jgi:protein-tyrosine kinase
MSADATSGEFLGFTERVREALTQSGKLTPEVNARIEEAMRAMALGFGDAIVHLGLVSPMELAEAMETARQHAPAGSDGIIETALQRMHGSRNLPVKYFSTCKAGPELMVAHHGDSAYSEQIRALRTELLLLNSASSGANIIALLSPCAGEGRTRLCAELAVAYSQLGRRTLLVDADLRRPRMHKLFEADVTGGLGQALTLRSAPQLLAVEKLPHLFVVMAGPTTHNPLELLSNGHFEAQISDWRKKYEMVIIDTPPVTEYADGLAIASCVEQVLVISRADSTPHKNMKEMLRRLATTQSRIVGAVINRF